MGETGWPVQARYWLLAIALLLFVPVGIVAKQAMASLFVALAVLLLATHWVEWRRLPLPPLSLVLPFAAILGLALLAELFAPVGAFDAANLARKLGMLALVLWLISCSDWLRAGIPVERLVSWLAGGVLLGAAILIIELNFDAPIYRFFSGKGAEVDVAPSRFNRGGTALVLLSWPAAAALWLRGNRLGALAVVLIGPVAASTGESASAALAAVAAYLILPWAVLSPRSASRLVFVAAAILMLAAPWVFVNATTLVPDYATLLPPSFAERLEIWHSVALQVIEQPFLGHGLGAIRVLEVPEEVRAAYHFYKAGTTHPHDAAIQLWLELGVFGVLAALALLHVAIRGADSLPRPAQAAVVSALVCGLVIASVAYGIWQETWLGMIGMTVLAFSVLCRDGSRSF